MTVADYLTRWLDGKSGLRASTRRSFHLLTFRGLRRGEAVGLPWAEVDLAARSLMVSEQIVQLDYRTETGAASPRSRTTADPAA